MFGAGIVGTGSASADHYLRGQCVKLIHDYQPFTDCTRDDFGPIYEKDTRGAVFDECQTEYGR